MNFDTAASALQLLNGRKLHVLIALVALQRQMPVSELDVSRMVGCNRKTARSHLQALEALGIVRHLGDMRKRPWTLGDDVEQIPLPLLWQGHDGKFIVDENPDVNFGEGNFYPLPPSSSSSSSIEGAVKTFEKEEEEGLGEGNFYPHQVKAVDRLSKVKPGLVTALEGSGIGRNMWERLAALEWVTAEYINAHVWLAQKNGDPVNYLMQRLLSGDAMPIVPTVCPDCGSEIDPDWGRCFCQRVNVPRPARVSVKMNRAVSELYYDVITGMFPRVSSSLHIHLEKSAMSVDGGDVVIHPANNLIAAHFERHLAHVTAVLERSMGRVVNVRVEAAE